MKKQMLLEMSLKVGILISLVNLLILIK